MAYKVTFEKHGECHVSKSLASRGGAHILNLLMDADMDNGTVVKQGDFVEIDLYKAVKGSEAEFVVREQDASGLWRIEVTKPGDEFILTTVPIADTGYDTMEYQDDALFYNGKGEVARAHALSKYDTYLVSEAAVNGALTAGATVTVSDGKLTAAAGGTE